MDKKKKQENKKKLLYVLWCIPFIAGLIGYLEFYRWQILDGIYFALKNYGLGYGIEEKSLLLEVARWGGLLAVTTVVITGASNFFVKFKNYLILKFTKKNIIAIYGSESKTEYLIRNLEGGDERYVVLDKVEKSAKIIHHIVMYKEPEDNLRFYSSNINNFGENVPVHVLIDKFSPLFLNHKDVDFYPFSLSELTAQLFWKNKYGVLQSKIKANKVYKIVFIVSGIYFDKMLDYALNINVFDKNQQIEYHIFGDLEEYKSIHYKLKKVDSSDDRTELELYPNDKLIFHKTQWYENAEFLTTVDEVIVCGDKDCDVLDIASSLISYLPGNKTEKIPLYLQIKDSKLINKDIAQDSKENYKDVSGVYEINFFGDYNEICTYEQITNNKIIDHAIKLNYEYCYPDKNHDDNLKQSKIEWGKLDNFKRDSNILSALFSELFTSLNKQPTEELEHIRWCRFHYMYNWEYAEKRDDIKRKHSLLTDYENIKK